MYPQFAENHAMRGIPEASRSPVRHPYLSYYGPKLPEGAQYGGMSTIQRLPIPFSGKPGAGIPQDMMYGHGWNPVLLPQAYTGPKNMMNKPEYPFQGQEHLYNRVYTDPNSMGGGVYPGFVPPGQPYPSYGVHPRQFGNMVTDGYAESTGNYVIPNDLWKRQHQSMMLGDGGDRGSPGPRGGWSSQEMIHHDPNHPSSSVSRNSPGISKESSVSNLKDVLLSSTQPYNDKSYQLNSSPYLGVGGTDTRDRTSPVTPNMVPTPGSSTSHHMSAGMVGTDTLSPSISNTVEQDGITPKESETKQITNQSQNSPFEVEAILGLKESSNGENNKSSPINEPCSPSSSVGAGSPRNRKLRTPFPMSPVDRNHSSLTSQYILSDEPGRKDFLDSLFKYLEREGIPLLRVPTISKSQLDLYKTFTTVQQLGGFRHVVDKRMWKDVLRSFNTSPTTSSSSLRIIQEYYVKMLLPYECHLSNSNLQDNISHYEMKSSPVQTTANNIHDSYDESLANNDPPNRTSSCDSEVDETNRLQPDQQRTNSTDNLLFTEESQNSLDGLTNQPLPDISVQEAESVLGIPGSSNTHPPQATPTPSYSPFQQGNWMDYTHDDRMSGPSYPVLGDSYNNPQQQYSFNDYNDYRRMQMSSFMHRQAYMGGSHPPPHLPPPGGMNSHYIHYPGMISRSRDDVTMNNAEWQWNQRTPRLPPPLPPHLQSMMFQVQPSPPPPPPPSLPPSSSQTSTSQVSSNSMIDHSSSQPNSQGLDPIKIQWQDQGPNSTQEQVKTSNSEDKPDKLVERTSSKTPDNRASEMRSHSIPVESTEPSYTKRRKLNCDHCGHVEPWRVMMSLKSGLGSDATWALDTLSILLHDDRTVGFFYLKHHHSLLNTLVDHFTKCLYNIFDSPFDVLPKYVESSPDNNNIEALVYHMSAQDIRLGQSDHLSHIHTYSEIDSKENPQPSSHPMNEPLPDKRIKISCVDETPLAELVKRDALTERILIHLKTPRRLMARSPIQKCFPSSREQGIQSTHNHFEENEVFKKETLPLVYISPQQEALQHRCLTISNIIRSLSFIPGNDIEFSQHPGLLIIIGHILRLHHTHLLKYCGTSSQNSHITEDILPPTITQEYWWWDCLEILRENVFVILANISGQLDLSLYAEAVSYPLVDGLLHWLVCPSSVATDPLSDSALVYSLSPQRLVVEALAKMSISEVNVDYILATPPLTRLDLVYSTLLQFVGQKKQPAVRQFALVFLSNLAQGGEGASRMIGQQKMSLPLLLECLESSEQVSRSRVMYNNNPDDPSSLSIAMLRRAAITLHCLARVPLNRLSFLPYCNRILTLSMSHSLDPSLTSIVSDVVFELTRIV